MAAASSLKGNPPYRRREVQLKVLCDRYQYPVNHLAVEYGVNFGREVKRADIVVLDKDRVDTAYIIVEIKKPKLKEGKRQLRSYCNATGAPMSVWTNGEQISYYQRKDPNYFNDISDIPNVHQTLADILKEKFTLDDLITHDKLKEQRKSLKTLIEEMEDEVLANAGVDVFEEVFKLIFTKLYDEWYSGQGDRRSIRQLEFRNTGQTETALKNKIQSLFDKAKQKWEGVFSEDSKITLTPSHLAVCVSSLEDVKLFNSNLDVVDDAFEYLINKSSKGEKGQFFTPRYVIDMCIKMLNPQEDEYIIDTAAGSSGFPVHTIFYVWKQILEDEGIEASHLFSLEDKPPRCEEYVEDKVFAIDFDKKAVMVARTLNLIAGDGQTNVLHLNTLDYERWDERIKDETWQDIYFDGFKRLRKRRPKGSKDYREFQFDILMANPPFAGDIKESRIIARYDLEKKPNGKWQNKLGRDILFIERNLDFLKPGGRMAIVLPQGRFNNSSDKQIRDYIAEKCRILAVVGLHGNTFKPHTGTKTSVLFVQKWNDDPKLGALCPRKDDYNIFFATMRKSGKDNSGEKIYRQIPPSNDTPLNKGGLGGSFDAEKYERLMDRLEVSIVKYSSLEFTRRFDSEYYQKEFLNFEQKVLHKDYSYLDEEANFLIGPFGSQFIVSNYEEKSPYRYIRGKDVKPFFVVNEDNVYIPEFDFNRLEKYKLKENDILISVVGTLGNALIVTEHEIPAIFSCKSTVVRTKDVNFAKYLLAYINSEVGRKLLIRKTRGAIQTGLNLDDLKTLLLFLPNTEFQVFIAKIIDNSKKNIDLSKKIYQKAEELLLSELGLKDWQPSEENIAVKSFAESFGKSDRIDAEYYQPKYDDFYQRLEKAASIKKWEIKQYKQLSSKFKYGTSDSLIYLEDGIPFLRIADLQKYRFDPKELKFISTEAAKKQKAASVQVGDVLISRSGTLGLAIAIPQEFDGAIFGSYFILTRPNPQVLHPTYLAFYINSLIGKLQTKQANTGAIQTNLTIPVLEKLKIACPSLEVQQNFIERVNQSYDAEDKSKQLLEIAKTGVEKAIEETEERAIDWINQQLDKLNINLSAVTENHESN
ncbi:MAG: N-6 DNA methylase [Xenococcaceae cyanobacterium MO_207.B15]|nr:N-6 DNA methylase [Xenococcaceae cyanobacterium MO_207.B15]